MKSVWMRGDAAQATVEMAVVLPVMLAVALIAYNLMSFIAASARFDRVAPDIVLAHGTSPDGAGGGDGVGNGDGMGPDSVGGGMVERVERELASAMGGDRVTVEVTVEGGEGGTQGQSGFGMLSLVAPLRTYRCVMEYEPWPSIRMMAGVGVGTPVRLRHEREVTVDPWRSGVVV